jgi:hypothetical protein
MSCDVYLLGWDVGPWKCSGKSKDALHAMKWPGGIEPRLTNEGKPFRGNLLEETGGKTGIDDLLKVVGVRLELPAKLILAVDAVFGWPQQFLSLIGGKTPYTPKHGCDEKATQNQYLYRETERFLVDRFPMRSNPPMTAVGDAIGNAGTKAQYVINRMRTGGDFYVPPFDTWDMQCAAEKSLTIIEVYPSALKFSNEYKKDVELPDGTAASSLDSGDAKDAILAVLAAACYAESIGMISGGFPKVWLPPDADSAHYDEEAISREGWIFTPK